MIHSPKGGEADPGTDVGAWATLYAAPAALADRWRP